MLISLFQLTFLLLFISQYQSFVFVNAVECSSMVWCHGSVLDIVNNYTIFEDSKEFVDRPLKTFDDEEFLRLWNSIPQSSRTKELVSEFITNFTYPAGYDLMVTTPTDWVKIPQFLQKIPLELQQFGKSLHDQWLELYRGFNFTGIGEGCSSAIRVPHSFMVAGGRFREFYYWDSYWIIRGLLISDMPITAYLMIDNMFQLVDKFGFIPNGSRIYYLNRSQPPLLTSMVDDLFTYKHNITFLEEAYPRLVNEYNYWMTSHIRIIQDPTDTNVLFYVNHYTATTTTPRPESYREDIMTASLSSLPAADIYKSLGAGAESGWDFTSRWFGDLYNITTIRANNVLPVDLNSIMYRNEQLLAKYATILNKKEDMVKFTEAYQRRKYMLYRIFWNKDTNGWHDMLFTDTHKWPEVISTHFYPSNYLPIWAQASHFSEQYAQNILQTSLNGLIGIGGVPTSLLNTHQQWDNTNGWAPIQWFLVDALDGSELRDVKQRKLQIVNAFFANAYCAWLQSGKFYEKYSTDSIGTPGGGGEYTVQTGFGWTNGVLLDFLKRFGNDIAIPKCPQQN